ncbi:MAG: hypothetical protein V4597_18420 [Pseudomonadota bacterium]
MKGRKRCKRHGGMSPGAPRGPLNGNWRGGAWTKEAIEMRRAASRLLKSSRQALRAI